MDQIGPIPLTAYATAYHRMLETQSDTPLIVDPYAELLVKSIDPKNHSFSFQRRGYTIVRTHFMDLRICLWLSTHPTGQLVLLGAGLDTRAYRLECIPSTASIFELDMGDTITYKTDILKEIEPMCQLHRIAVNLTEDTWIEKLETTGLDTSRPILWIMEGLLYYLEQTTARKLLEGIKTLSAVHSALLADICVPGLVGVNFGLFLRYFKWGLSLDEVIDFFAASGWSVRALYADDVDQGRDVGQHGMIFVYSDQLDTTSVDS